MEALMFIIIAVMLSIILTISDHFLDELERKSKRKFNLKVDKNKEEN